MNHLSRAGYKLIYRRGENKVYASVGGSVPRTPIRNIPRQKNKRLKRVPQFYQNIGLGITTAVSALGLFYSLANYNTVPLYEAVVNSAPMKSFI